MFVVIRTENQFEWFDYYLGEYLKAFKIGKIAVEIYHCSRAEYIKVLSEIASERVN